MLFLFLIDTIKSIISHISKIANQIIVNGIKRIQLILSGPDVTTHNQRRKGNDMEIKIRINVFLDIFNKLIIFSINYH